MENQSIQPIEKGWVKVTNLTPTSTQEELVNLFGFCGYVSGITFLDNPETHQRYAIIEFWDKNAAVTACLLSIAMIQNQPIHVELYVANTDDQQHIANSSARSPGPVPVNVDPIAHQSRTATIAKAFASGIVMAKDVKDKAVAWDQGNLSLIQKAEVLGIHAKSNVEEINRRYHIADTVDELVKVAGKTLLGLKSNLEATEGYQIAKTKALELDTQYGISTTAFSIIEKAKSTATEFGQEVFTEVQKQSDPNPNNT